jgi:hypothetical protein
LIFSPLQKLHLPQEREHGALLLVSATELLTVSTLLLLGPNSHLSSSNRQEENSREVTTGKNGDSSPGHGLEQVVGTGNQVESVSTGNGALGGSAGTEVTESDVGKVVGELGEEEQSDGSVENSLVGSRIKSLGPPRSRHDTGGNVQPVGQVESGENPVVSAVLEDVESGHGGGGEAVDKDGLILALQEVQEDQGANELLSLGRRGDDTGGGRVDGSGQVAHGVPGGSGVEVRTERSEEERVDQKGSEVLDEEDGAPGNLGTWNKAVS